MKTKVPKIKYKAWLSPETMHNNSKKWLSELAFIQDEQLFFDDLIKSYTLQLIDSKHFTESKKIIDRLSQLQKENNTLFNTLKNHKRGLKIMVDGKDELEKEQAYRDKHAKLIIVVSKYLEKYQTIKKQLFTLVKGIIKEGKQKRLLN
ncbi:hypothetical protein [Aestuariivivens marinum]|uniref:hypothetical protein n=1 Tax=Aestuariivivens marinum TaxID=2913555 RepID=UPI001F5913A3|nr:hypothetical protein [Aestuariivivens marinum]